MNLDSTVVRTARAPQPKERRLRDSSSDRTSELVVDALEVCLLKTSYERASVISSLGKKTKHVPLPSKLQHSLKKKKRINEFRLAV